MNDQQLSRYARHILLNELGIEGQQRLLDAHVLLIGAGGLGCAAAMYLAASGVGQLTAVDDDTVELTNLQRQIAHTTARIDQFKVHSLAQTLQALNPDVQVRAIAQRVDGAALHTLVQQVDVVIDGCDNFQTRQAVNAACVAHKKPLISGAAMGFDGQISEFDTQQTDSPCYACLFPPEPPPPATNCATMGVCSPLVGIIGSLQACAALKRIAGIGTPLTGRLQMVNALSMTWRDIQFAKNPQCPVCAQPTHPHRS